MLLEAPAKLEVDLFSELVWWKLASTPHHHYHHPLHRRERSNCAGVGVDAFVWRAASLWSSGWLCF